MKPLRLSSTAGKRAGKVVKVMYGPTYGVYAPVINV